LQKKELDCSFQSIHNNSINNNMNKFNNFINETIGSFSGDSDVSGDITYVVFGGGNQEYQSAPIDQVVATLQKLNTPEFDGLLVKGKISKSIVRPLKMGTDTAYAVIAKDTAPGRDNKVGDLYMDPQSALLAASRK
jgi:hypothetical protein